VAPCANIRGMTTTAIEDVAVDEDNDDIVEELIVEEISIDGMCGVY
jgi:mycofactocin precursor